jgi:hypothetical protein
MSYTSTTTTTTVKNEKRIVSLSKEKEILDQIESHCEKWSNIANAYVACIIVFGVSAVSTSVLVSIYTGNERLIGVEAIKVLACISTISLAVLTAFNLVTNSANARNAWRTLNASIMLYKAGGISLEELIEQYQKGENQIGNFSFNYGSNGDKPSTFTQEIKASDAVNKQKEADEAQQAAVEAQRKLTEATLAKNKAEQALTDRKAEQAELQKAIDDNVTKQKDLEARKSAGEDVEEELQPLIALSPESQASLIAKRAEVEDAEQQLTTAADEFEKASKLKEEADIKYEKKQKEAKEA